MLLNKTLLAIVLAASTTPALAQNSELLATFPEVPTTASIFEVPDFQSALLLPEIPTSSAGNLAPVLQQGMANTAFVSQIGDRNVGAIIQSGKMNAASITQSGVVHRALIFQAGSNNSAVIFQQ